MSTLDDKPPRVSVIMPVYNGEAFLAEAIESVLAQSFTDFEFLIHDDGSSDSSSAILEAYAARDSRIRLSSAPNQGVAAGLNVMIAAARGEYIARMDADDICLPDRFALQLAEMDKRPGLVALGTAKIDIDAAGRPIARLTPPGDHEVLDRQHLRGLCSLVHPSVMMRKAAVDLVGGYDRELRSSQDLDLWLRLAEVGELANLEIAGLKYRVHENSVSGRRRDEQMANCRRSCEKAWARRGVTAPFEYRHWRMDDSRASRVEHYLRYGWQAWDNGFRATWRHYAWRSVAQAPVSAAAWKLLIFGALRRPGGGVRKANG